MYRTPPRRQPRIAALVRAQHAYVLVVLDPWEVRTVVVSRSRTCIRRSLLRERPVAIVTSDRLPWMRAAKLVLNPARCPREGVARVPELRRFAGSPYAEPITRAIALANKALEHYSL